MLECFETYRYKNLVYLRTLKCASTYYSRLLINNGWIQESGDRIDWNADHVFSFIMNPFERRLKGLTEFVCVNQLYNLLTNTNEKFWSNILYLDIHSLPYTLSYKDYLDKIDWIPIDQSYSCEDLFEKLMHDYGISINYKGAARWKKSSSLEQLEIYNTIKQLGGICSAHTFNIIEENNRFYTRVIENIQHKDSWEKCSWLQSTYK